LVILGGDFGGDADRLDQDVSVLSFEHDGNACVDREGLMPWGGEEPGGSCRTRSNSSIAIRTSSLQLVTGHSQMKGTGA
jgi:hypothetical protein